MTEVSVIVPAYNADRYLGATLASLLAQRGVDLEVIVVDDNSRDSTAAVVHEYAQRDARVRYERTPSNCGGPAGPRNLGVERAQAPWVAFCDADDLWHPDKLRAQLACARDTGADLVCTALRDFPDGQLPALNDPPRSPQVVTIRYWSMLLKNRVATSSVLVRRATVQAAGGFPVERDLIAVEDYDLWLRILSMPGTRAIRLDHALVAYRRLSGSLSASKLRQARKVIRVLQRAFERRGWAPVFPLAAPLLMLSYGLSSVYLRMVRGHL